VKIIIIPFKKFSDTRVIINMNCVSCNSSSIYYKCKSCEAYYCFPCFNKNCDTGGGQDLDVYFQCLYMGDEPSDHQLVSYLLKKEGKTREQLVLKYKKDRKRKPCETICIKRYNHDTGEYHDP
jgi:hypothetical protein